MEEEVELKANMVERAKNGREEKRERMKEARALYHHLLAELNDAHVAVVSMKRYWVTLKPMMYQKLRGLYDSSKWTDNHDEEALAHMYAGVKEIEKKGGRRLSYGYESGKQNNGLALVPAIDKIGGAQSSMFWINAVQHLAHGAAVEKQLRCV